MGNRHTMFYMGKEYPNIPMGGGFGGGGGEITLLASPPSGSTYFPLSTNITLSEDMNNFDFLMFSPVYNGNPTAVAFPPAIITVDSFKALSDRFYTYYGGAGYNDVKYINDTTVMFLRNGNEAACAAIHGIKLGSGGGGSQTTKDDLFTNTGTANPATITFDNPITDYDEIRFMVRAGSNAVATMTYDVENLITGDTIGAGFYTGVFAWYYYTDSQTLTFRVSAGGGYISNIVGIKY